MGFVPECASVSGEQSDAGGAFQRGGIDGQWQEGRTRGRARRWILAFLCALWACSGSGGCSGCAGRAGDESPAQLAIPTPKPKRPQYHFSEPEAEPDHEPGGLSRRGELSLARVRDGELELYASSADDELSTGALGLRHLLMHGMDGGTSYALEPDGGDLSPGLLRWTGQKVRLYRGSSFACMGEVTELRAVVRPPALHEHPPLGSNAAVVVRVRPDGEKACDQVTWGRWAMLPVAPMAAPLEKVAPTEFKRLKDSAVDAFRAMPRYQQVQARYEQDERAAEEAENKTPQTEETTDELVHQALGGGEGSGEELDPDTIQLGDAVGSDPDNPGQDQAEAEEEVPDAGHELPRWDSPAKNIGPAVRLFRMTRDQKTYAGVYAKTGDCTIPGGEMGALFDVVTEGGDTSFVLWNDLPDVHLPQALIDADGDGAIEVVDDVSVYQRVDGGYVRTEFFPDDVKPDGGC